jgi:hypothetical protein
MPEQTGAPSAVEVLALLHQLSLSACRSSSSQALIFQMLNDTVQLANYDLATLWTINDNDAKLIGISGQAQHNKTTGIAEKWHELVKDIRAADTPQTLTKDSFIKKEKVWLEMQAMPTSPNVQWFPIFAKKKLVMGLWLERWGNKTWQEEEVNILNFLMQAYGVAWEKFMPKYSLKSIGKRQVIFLAIIFMCGLFLIRVPLRIVAPCEIVPKDPIMITAPLEGIIAEMLVKPGQEVVKDDVLFSYDKRVPHQELKVTQKQVLIIQSELNRALTLAFKDNRPLAEVATLRIKLQKEQIRLDYAQYQMQKLEVVTPQNGIVMLDNPEDWRGKPVRIGERVLVVSDPDKTKVRIWIPEADNVLLDGSKSLKIFLNISPESSKKAELLYIANYTSINEQGIPSFVAEAEWVGIPHGIKMGLKGTAILYGNEVSLFYWIIRRPWTTFRNTLGI